MPRWPKKSETPGDNMPNIEERLAALEKANTEKDAKIKELESGAEETRTKLNPAYPKELSTKFAVMQEGVMHRELRSQREVIHEPAKLVKKPVLICEQCKKDSISDAGTCSKCGYVAYRLNICPFCEEIPSKQNVCDVTKGGKWACRTCGKHWFPWAIGKKYSLLLEQGEREKVELAEKREHEIQMSRKGVQV